MGVTVKHIESIKAGDDPRGPNSKKLKKTNKKRTKGNQGLSNGTGRKGAQLRT